MSPTDNDDFSPPPSEEEERLLRTVRQLSPEKKRRLSELMLQTEIVHRPKKPEGEEPE